MFLLRSSPTFQHPDLLADFDVCLKSCATDICNTSFDDIDWIQATLPIRLGGIGLRRASDLALPAHLASILLLLPEKCSFKSLKINAQH